jgi:hypothetical protein
VTRFHDMREKNTPRWDRTDPASSLGRRQHRHSLDTILIVDHERKHSASTIAARDEERPAWRGMLVLLTRKTRLDGHVPAAYDSTRRTPSPSPSECPNPPGARPERDPGGRVRTPSVRLGCRGWTTPKNLT